MAEFRPRAAVLLLALACGWILPAPVLRAEPVVPLPAKLAIGKKAGTRLDAVYLRFNYTELSASFALEDGAVTPVVRGVGNRSCL